MPVTNFDELRVSSGYLRDGAVKERMGLATIAVGAGVTEATLIAKFAGVLSAVQLTPGASLAANDTNWIQFAIKNKGSGAANVDMLDTGAGNSTKATGGVALTAYTKRTLTLHATPANLAVAAGDTLSLTATVTGTLAGAVTAPSFMLTFTPT